MSFWGFYLTTPLLCNERSSLQRSRMKILGDHYYKCYCEIYFSTAETACTEGGVTCVCMIVCRWSILHRNANVKIAWCFWLLCMFLRCFMFVVFQCQATIMWLSRYIILSHCAILIRNTPFKSVNSFNSSVNSFSRLSVNSVSRLPLSQSFCLNDYETM